MDDALVSSTTTLTDPDRLEDGSFEILNESDIETGTVMEALAGQHPEVAALVRWSYNLQPTGGGRQSSMFERDRYVTPRNIFDQFRTAHDAAENDDTVSGIVESTESLAFSRMSFLCEDEDEEDVWNQIASDIDLDSRLREMWRELFTVSQFYCLTWWGRKTYKVRGKTDEGNKKRKTFDNIYVPLGMSILDPLKVVPVGNILFGMEQLAYIGDRAERDMLDAAAAGDPLADPVAKQIILQKYEPNDLERKWLYDLNIAYEFLYLLNPQNVWRHTVTRPQYQRWAPVRMKSVFELLDLKQQLRAMDRAHLIGGTNFIILIRKGTDQHPAKPQETAQLQAQVRTIAQVPVIVGDHRLDIEIITPKTDTTLNPDKYNGLDARITARLYLMFMTGNFAAGAKGDDSIKLAKIVARGLESRRHMMRRGLERNLLKPTYERNDALSNPPKLRFLPGRIELDFDAAMVAFLMDNRDRGNLSRETILGEIGLDQADEAVLREREGRRYDDVFTPTNVPFTGVAGAPADPASPGGKGAAGGQQQPAAPAGGAPGGPAPAPPELPPHSHGPIGEPVALPPAAKKAMPVKQAAKKAPAAKKGAPAKAAPAKKAASVSGGGRADKTAKGAPPNDPRTAGRNLGGRRNGGGAAPGTGQGKAPRKGKPKS